MLKIQLLPAIRIQASGRAVTLVTARHGEDVDLREILLGAGLAALMSGRRRRRVRIRGDAEDQSAPTWRQWWRSAVQGEQVVIDGPCLSACTALGVIPRERICVTPRARLGFQCRTGQKGRSASPAMRRRGC